MKRDLLLLVVCPACRGHLRLDMAENEIRTKALVCEKCSTSFPVVNGIPYLLDSETEVESQTGRLYGDIWKNFNRAKKCPGGGYRAPARSHIELLVMASGVDVIEGNIGIDAGCGNGSTVIGLANAYPSKTIVGVDLSDGMSMNADEIGKLRNAHLVRGNLLAFNVKCPVHAMSY